jgi:RimJ/RimL family protein N-acetyltransferase
MLEQLKHYNDNPFTPPGVALSERFYGPKEGIDNIILRPITGEETWAVLYKKSLNSPEGREFMWSDTPRDLDGIANFLRAFRENPRCQYYIIEVETALPFEEWEEMKNYMPMGGGLGPSGWITKETTLIGHVGLRKDEEIDGVYWLSYFNTNLRLRRRGYIKRAVRLLLKRLRTDMDVRARVSRKNIASIKILEATMEYFDEDEEYLYYQWSRET